MGQNIEICEIEPLNLAEVLQRIGNDLCFLADLLDEFNDLLAGQLKALDKAARESRLDIIMAEAHKIKGAASNLSAGKVADFTKKLELSAQRGDISEVPGLLDQLKCERKKLLAFAKEVREKIA